MCLLGWMLAVSVCPNILRFKGLKFLEGMGGGGGVSKTKKFKEKFEACLEFPERWGTGFKKWLSKMCYGACSNEQFIWQHMEKLKKNFFRKCPSTGEARWPHG